MYYDIHEAQLRTAEIARDADDVDYKFCEITVPLTKKATEYHSSLEVVEKQPIAYNIPTANPMQFLVPIVFGRDDPKFLRHFVGTIYLLPFGKVGWVSFNDICVRSLAMKQNAEFTEGV